MRLLNHLGWFTFAQSEHILAYSHGTLQKMVTRGMIPARRMGSYWIIRGEALYAALCARYGLDKSAEM